MNRDEATAYINAAETPEERDRRKAEMFPFLYGTDKLPRPPQPDPFSDWCDEHQIWHQKRKQPIECLLPGCREKTDHAHGTCPRHRKQVIG